MGRYLIAVGVAGLILGRVDLSWAHYGDQVYPIFQLTDEDVTLIDVKDGSIDDWLEVVGEPSLTALDFPTGDNYDPADLDFRVWLAWHDGTNRIYGAMQQADDLYVLNDKDRQHVTALMFHDAAINFYIDGDHSAGKFIGSANRYQTAQWYLALGGAYSAGPVGQ